MNTVDEVVDERKPIKVSASLHPAIESEARSFGGLSKQAMADAMIRGWALLSQSQKFTAVCGKQMTKH